jgi:ABC-2 type transport system permease protein
VLSLALAVVTSFGIRFLVACSAFWLLDQTGMRMLSGVAAIFLSGMTLPLVIFPEPLRSIALALPWASYLQTPADIWLGQRSGAGILDGLALQAVWVAVLMALCHVVLGVATRKVVVQGG